MAAFDKYHIFEKLSCWQCVVLVRITYLYNVNRSDTESAEETNAATAADTTAEDANKNETNPAKDGSNDVIDSPTEVDAATAEAENNRANKKSFGDKVTSIFAAVKKSVSGGNKNKDSLNDSEAKVPVSFHLAVEVFCSLN